MCSIGWVTIGADGAIACLIICRWTRCHRRSPHSIFFGRFRNLRVDDCRCRVALAPAGFAASLHERLMNTIEHAVARPFPEIIINRGVRRKIFWQLPPLATRAIYIADCVEHLAHVCLALASTRAGRRDHRLDDSPLLVGHITRITSNSRLVHLALLVRPHGSPLLSPNRLPLEFAPAHRALLPHAISALREHIEL